MSLLRVYRQRRIVRGSSRKRWPHDLAMVSVGFLLALVFSTAVFELLNVQFHWIGGQTRIGTGGVQPTPMDLAGLHGAAPKTDNPAGGAQLLMTTEKTGAAYAVPGQKDVALLKFTLSPSNDGFIHAMTFALGNLAYPQDLKSLKLFAGDAQLGEVSFFDGKGAFRNLMIKLAANQLLTFSVLGTVSDQAQIGDRLMLKLADDKGIDAVDSDGVPFQLVGNFSGQPVSVVRGR